MNPINFTIDLDDLSPGDYGPIFQIPIIDAGRYACVVRFFSVFNSNETSIADIGAQASLVAEVKCGIISFPVFGNEFTQKTHPEGIEASGCIAEFQVGPKNSIAVKIVNSSFDFLGGTVTLRAKGVVYRL